MEPRFRGAKVILARSFARIHETNAKKQGLLPLTFADPDTYELIGQDDTISVLGLADLAPDQPVRCRITKPDGTTSDFEATHTFSPDQIEWFRPAARSTSSGATWRPPADRPLGAISARPPPDAGDGRAQMEGSRRARGVEPREGARTSQWYGQPRGGTVKLVAWCTALLLLVGAAVALDDAGTAGRPVGRHAGPSTWRGRSSQPRPGSTPSPTATSSSATTGSRRCGRASTASPRAATRS
jgi:hypothetical protein